MLILVALSLLFVLFLTLAFVDPAQAFAFSLLPIARLLHLAAVLLLRLLRDRYRQWLNGYARSCC